MAGSSKDNRTAGSSKGSRPAPGRSKGNRTAGLKRNTAPARGTSAVSAVQ